MAKITFVEQMTSTDVGFLHENNQDDNGNSYFNVDIGAVKGYVCAKTQWFKVGDEFNFNVDERTSKKDRWQFKIHLVKPETQKQVSLSGESMSFDEAALYRAPEKSVESASVSLSGQQVNTETILDRAEVIFNWITGKIKKIKEELNTEEKPE